jgi:hypothetical protein
VAVAGVGGGGGYDDGGGGGGGGGGVFNNSCAVLARAREGKDTPAAKGPSDKKCTTTQKVHNNTTPSAEFSN